MYSKCINVNREQTRENRRTNNCIIPKFLCICAILCENCQITTLEKVQQHTELNRNPNQQNQQIPLNLKSTLKLPSQIHRHQHHRYFPSHDDEPYVNNTNWHFSHLHKTELGTLPQKLIYVRLRNNQIFEQPIADVKNNLEDFLTSLPEHKDSNISKANFLMKYKNWNAQSVNHVYIKNSEDIKLDKGRKLSPGKVPSKALSQNQIQFTKFTPSEVSNTTKIRVVTSRTTRPKLLPLLPPSAEVSRTVESYAEKSWGSYETELYSFDEPIRPGLLSATTIPVNRIRDDGGGNKTTESVTTSSRSAIEKPLVNVNLNRFALKAKENKKSFFTNHLGLMAITPTTMIPKDNNISWNSNELKPNPSYFTNEMMNSKKSSQATRIRNYSFKPGNNETDGENSDVKLSSWKLMSALDANFANQTEESDVETNFGPGNAEEDDKMTEYMSPNATEPVNSKRSQLITVFKQRHPVKIWTAVGFYTDEYLEKVDTHWLQYEPTDPTVHKVLMLMYGIIMGIGFSGNLLVIVMFIRCRSLRTPPNYLVVNLAVSDIMMMTKMPIFMYNSFYGGPVLGDIGCKIYGFVGGLSGVTSIMTLAAISIDRYFVIVYPLNPLKRMTSSRACGMLMAVWIYSGFFSSLPLLGVINAYVSEGFLTSCSFDYLSDKLEDRIFVFVFFIAAWVFPLCVILYSYYNIFRIVHETEKFEVFNPKDLANGVVQRESFKCRHASKKQKTEVKIAILSSILILIWSLAWTPYAIVALLGIFGFKDLLTPMVSAIPALFCKTASCVDPFLYAINHPRFQKELRSKYPLWFRLKRASSANASYSNNTLKDSLGSLNLNSKKKKRPELNRDATSRSQSSCSTYEDNFDISFKPPSLKKKIQNIEIRNNQDSSGGSFRKDLKSMKNESPYKNTSFSYNNDIVIFAKAPNEPNESFVERESLKTSLKSKRSSGESKIRVNTHAVTRLTTTDLPGANSGPRSPSVKGILVFRPESCRKKEKVNFQRENNAINGKQMLSDSEASGTDKIHGNEFDGPMLNSETKKCFKSSGESYVSNDYVCRSYRIVIGKRPENSHTNKNINCTEKLETAL